MVQMRVYMYHYFEEQYLYSEWDGVRMHCVGYFMLVVQLIGWAGRLLS